MRVVGSIQEQETRNAVFPVIGNPEVHLERVVGKCKDCFGIGVGMDYQTLVRKGLTVLKYQSPNCAHAAPSGN